MIIDLRLEMSYPRTLLIARIIRQRILLGSQRTGWRANSSVIRNISRKIIWLTKNMSKTLVPADRLLTFDYKEGWEPLCSFLDKPVRK